MMWINISMPTIDTTVENHLCYLENELLASHYCYAATVFNQRALQICCNTDWYWKFFLPQHHCPQQLFKDTCIGQI